VGGEHPINHIRPKKLSRAVADLIYGRPAGYKQFTMFVGWHTFSILGLISSNFLSFFLGSNNQVSLLTKERSAYSNGHAIVCHKTLWHCKDSHCKRTSSSSRVDEKRVESWNKPVLSFDMRAPTIPPACADNPHHCATFALSHYIVGPHLGR